MQTAIEWVAVERRRSQAKARQLCRHIAIFKLTLVLQYNSTVLEYSSTRVRTRVLGYSSMLQ